MPMGRGDRGPLARDGRDRGGGGGGMRDRGGPPRGGEMVIGLSPELIAGPGWEDHVEGFMDRLSGLEGVRIPGARRHQNRLDTGPRNINESLVETIRGLT